MTLNSAEKGGKYMPSFRKHTLLVAALYFPVLFSVLIALASLRSRLTCPPAASMKLSRKSRKRSAKINGSVITRWDWSGVRCSWGVLVLCWSYGNDGEVTYASKFLSKFSLELIHRDGHTSRCFPTDLTRPCFASSSAQKKGGKFILHFFWEDESV